MTYTQGITIDGQYFDVPFASVKRSADVLDKYAERSDDGVLHREVLGVYINYVITFGIIDDEDLYNRLFDKLTEPVEFHTISIPNRGDQAFEFHGYIAKVSDEMLKVYDESIQWQNLTCSMVQERPNRVPQ